MMVDYEKVLKGLECMANDDATCTSDCPYFVNFEHNCVGDMARDALKLLKEQQETIELQGSLLTLAHAAMSHGKKEGLTNGARPGRN